MKKQLQVVITSPERMIYDGIAERISFPGSMGAFTVYPDHAPIISSLDKGKITCKKENGVIEVEIKDGFVEVKNNKISVCVEEMQADGLREPAERKI